MRTGGRTPTHAVLPRRPVLQGSLALLGLGPLSGCQILSPRTALPAKLPHIGWPIYGDPPHGSALEEAVLRGLQARGYVEGQTIVIDYRYAGGQPERLPALAAAPVTLPVDLLVAAAGFATIEAARGATRTIPIVFPTSGDPVQAGFAVSLARPGGNMTGLSNLAVQVGTKKLQVLRELVPGIIRVLLLTDTADPSTADSRDMRAAAQALGIDLQRPDLRTAADFSLEFEQALHDHVEGLAVGGQPVIRREIERIIAFAAQNRLPAVYDRREFIAAGGLLSYGVNVPDLFRRAATYVDKILKGAKPADLPIERPTRFDFVVNLRTAQALGLTIPPTVLAQATEVLR